jgi:predicted metal-dependent phosphoesterase TrpH
MIVDMHVHTRASLDSPASVEEYCRTAHRFRKYHPFDGIVFTEHRFFDEENDYRAIADKYELFVFKGIEMDTDLGHLLVYGVTKRFLKKIDVSQLRIKAGDVIRAISDYGGIAVPSHPFRESAFGETLESGAGILDGISVIETLNGSSTGDENHRAARLSIRNGFSGIGGSDAHYVNAHWFLNAATEFENPVHTDEDLVRELKGGKFSPIVLDNSMLKKFK